MKRRRSGISVIPHGDKFLGVYHAPDGRRAVITLPASSEKAAVQAAESWVAEAFASELAKIPPAYFWVRHPELEGFYEVFREHVGVRRGGVSDPKVH